MLGDDNKFFVFKSLLTMTSNVLPQENVFVHNLSFHWGEGDGIKSRLPFKKFSTWNEKFTLSEQFAAFIYFRTCWKKLLVTILVVIKKLPCEVCIFLWKALQNEKDFHIKYLSVKIAKILNCNSPIFQISEQKSWIFQKGDILIA